MATARRNRKKEFSPAQLRAQRAFARMAKERARAARAKKRNQAAKLRARKRPASRKLNTRRVASRKPVARRKANKRPARRGVLLTGRKRVARRRRNDGAAELRQTFSGLPQDHVTEMTAPEGTPAHVVEMGDLLELKTSKETISFEEGEAVLAVDAKEKLHILQPVGNQGAFEAFEKLGSIEQVTYGADKKDGSGYVEYYHNFGEEGGTQPSLETDREGMLHIKGGSYTIDEVFTNPMRRRLKRRTRK